MLNCQQASQLFSQSLDRSLTRRERFALKLHLFICKYCKRFSQQLQAMRDAIKRDVARMESDPSIELPTEAKTRIANLIDKN